MQTVMKEQLSIFDIPITTTQIKKKGLIEELSELASQYLIDSHYKKITFGRTLTISQIAESLMKFKRFPEYIDKVYEILVKYYERVESKVGGFDVIGIEKIDNCIRIYQPRQQYPIYCISMIDGSFYRYARKEEKI